MTRRAFLLTFLALAYLYLCAAAALHYRPLRRRRRSRVHLPPL